MITILPQDELRSKVLLVFFEDAQEKGEARFLLDVVRMLPIEVGTRRVELAVEELKRQGLLENKWSEDEREQGYAISAKGYLWVEERLKQGEVASARFELEGQKHLGDLTALIPASDRMVPLNHNSAPYAEIETGLRDLEDLVRSANDLDVSSEERSRLVKSVRAARSLWEAFELRALQIYVGILMVVNDAKAALSKVGKSVGVELLAAVIVNFLKSAGISL